jgi:hypothetical protein
MYSEELIRKTREVFEPKYGKELTLLEVEEIINNMADFAKILIEFDKSAGQRGRQNINGV